MCLERPLRGSKGDRGGSAVWSGAQEGGGGGEADESVMGSPDGPYCPTGAVTLWGQQSPFFPHASLSSFSGQAAHSAFHELHLLPIPLGVGGSIGIDVGTSVSPKPHPQPLGRRNS